MSDSFRALRAEYLSATDAGFILRTPDGTVATHGVAAPLAPGPLVSLTARSAAFFSRRDSGPDLLVGAIPYDRAAADCLFQPDALGEIAPSACACTDPGLCRIAPLPGKGAFRNAVAQALRRMEGTAELSKVVLSRSLNVFTEHELNPDMLLKRLSQDPLSYAFSTPLPSRVPGTTRRLIGATPELLVSRKGARVASHPLAGSARRSKGAADRTAAEALLQSAKDLREHAHAAEAVLDTLAPYCTCLSAPEGVALRATATMWHLGTRIEGDLKDPDTPVADLLAALHPTPAVCGLPRDLAEAVIRTTEGYDRGFYAGAVGWMNGAGDGEWYVALRCAEVEGCCARLFAGAGIVPGSIPESEASETSAKFLTMLSALGIDENGERL